MASNHPLAVRLGRRVNHDPRSRNFPAPMAAVIRPVAHRHYGPVLDQGQLGSCTGNAMAQALNTAPLHRAGTHLLSEADAVSIYSKATALDGAAGVYPPDDTGSDGLSVAKVAQKLGLIRSYGHAFSPDQARAALQLRPVLFGLNWYENMFEPDGDGFLMPGGALAGGHEVVLVKDTGKYLEGINSWGKSWGVAGRFRLTYATFAALMAEQGDITAPVQ